MSSRTLALAAVTLWAFAVVPAAAQNLEAGKTPTQIFASTCAVCHKGPRGLLKTVSPGALPGFLRQHYTTSTSMAGAMSSYVLSNGAAERPAAERSAPSHAATPPRGETAPESEQRQKPKVERRKPAAEGEASEPKPAARPAAKPQAKPPVAAEPAASPKPETPAGGTEPPAEIPAASEKPAEGGAPAAASESAPAPKEPEVSKPAPPPNMPVFELDKSASKPAASEKPADSAPAPNSDKPASN